MKYLYIVLFILVLLFLQIGIFPHLKIVGSFPNLIILSVLCLSILQGWKKSLIWIITAGLFLDLYSLNNFLGISVIGLLLASYLACFLDQNTFKKTNVPSLMLVFLISIAAYNIILIILSKIFGLVFDFRILGFFINLVYNLIFALPVFYIIKKWLIKNTK